MKIKNIILKFLVLIFIVGCNYSIIKDNKGLDNYDDELIEEIKNSSNKVEIEYNNLPTQVIATIENSYNSDIFFSEKYISSLGYELTLSDTDIDESVFKKIYFNLDGRKLVRKRDGEKRERFCFDLVFPITFSMPDESSIIVENDEGWNEVKEWYDENSSYGNERPSLQYPVDLIDENENITTINSDEEMEELKRTCIDCFELVFPITFIMPDGISIIVESDEGWDEIKEWYDENPGYDNQWPLIEFPIDIKLVDSEIITVNSESEMINLKMSCK